MFGQPRYYMLHLVARTLMGFCIGSMSCGFVWMMEWMPSSRYVTKTLSLLGHFYVFGERNASFCQARLGTNIGETQQEVPFSSSRSNVTVAMNVVWAVVAIALAVREKRTI